MTFDRKKWMHNYCVKYYQNHRKRLLEKQNEHERRKRKEDRQLVIEHYTKGKHCCSCCGELQDEFLTLDHVHQNGAEHRRKKHNRSIWRVLVSEGFPPGHQILCWNCNCARSFRSDNGVCPHEKFTRNITGLGEDIRG